MLDMLTTLLFGKHCQRTAFRRAATQLAHRSPALAGSIGLAGTHHLFSAISLHSSRRSHLRLQGSDRRSKMFSPNVPSPRLRRATLSVAGSLTVAPHGAAVYRRASAVPRAARGHIERGFHPALGYRLHNVAKFKAEDENPIAFFRDLGDASRPPFFCDKTMRPLSKPVKSEAPESRVDSSTSIATR